MTPDAPRFSAECSPNLAGSLPSQERGCAGKANLGRSYQRQAARLAAKHGKRYGVYACPHCGGTHLTTKLENAGLYAPLLYVTRPLTPGAFSGL
jgi:hypothetical protein